MSSSDGPVSQFNDFDCPFPELAGHLEPRSADSTYRLVGVLNWVLSRELGRGRFGIVYLVEDLVGRPGALKLLNPVWLGDGEKQQAFRREAEIAHYLSHERAVSRVVPVLDEGTTATGLPYYVMPHARGGSLRQLLARGPLTRNLTLHIAEEVAHALEGAHDARVRHHDLKPENILLDTESPTSDVDTQAKVLLIDFGLASQHDTDRLPPQPRGTPGYLAPEQVLGQRLDFAGEVYSLGVVLYEMLTGRRPYASPNENLAEQMAAGPPPKVVDVTPGADAALASIADKAIATEPTDRYANIKAMRRVLLDQMPLKSDDAAEPQRAGRTDDEPPPRLGRYQVLALIGSGAFGDVYRAYDPLQKRDVAVKHLKTKTDAKVARRFQREVRALRKTSHPHLARILDDGREAERDFYVMELVEGPPLTLVIEELRRLVRDGRVIDLRAWHEAVAAACRRRESQEIPLSGPGRPSQAAADALDDSPPDQSISAPATQAEPLTSSDVAPQSRPRLHSSFIKHVVELLRHAADAVNKLHREDVIHRDLSPANLLVSPDGQTLTVIDLGLAAVGGERSTVRTHEQLGTPAYCAPEQAWHLSGREPDATADVYSLGAVLWELLALRPLIDKTWELPAILTKTRPSVRKFSPRVPQDLAAAVATCLELDRRDRFQSAAELRDAFDDFLTDRPMRFDRSKWLYRIGKHVRRHRTTWLVTAVTVLALAGTTVFGMWRSLEVRDVTKTLDSLFGFILDFKTALASENHDSEITRDTLESMFPSIGENVNELISRTGNDPSAIPRLLALAELLLHLRHPESKRWEFSATDPKPGSPKETRPSRQDLAIASIAESLCRQTVAVGSTLRRDDWRIEEHQRNLAHSLELLANVHSVARRTDEALAALKDTSLIYRTLWTQNPTDIKKQRDYWSSLCQLGTAYRHSGNKEKAVEMFESALRISQEMVKRHPLDPNAYRDLGLSLDRAGNMYREVEEHTKSLALLDQGLAVRLARAKAVPGKGEIQREIGVSYFNLGCTYWALRRMNDALEKFEKSVEIADSLLEQNPHDRVLTNDLTEARYALSQCYLVINRPNTDRMNLYVDFKFSQSSELGDMGLGLGRANTRWY